MASLAIGLGTAIIGGIISSKGQSDAEEEQERGTQEQIRIEGLSREASEKEFKKQIARQKPFVDVGTKALPEFIKAISNRGNVSKLPATRIQKGLISDFLGENVPEFIRERSLDDLNAIEFEKNKGRLSDLINVGLGGVGSTAGANVNLGTTLGNSFATSGNIQAQSLIDSAASRENRQNQLIQGIAGLPALANTAFQNRPQSVNPFITAQNPLGLTPGAGL